MREVSAEEVELEYVSAGRYPSAGVLGYLWPVRFESVRPERGFPAFRGQGNWCGWYWSATCGGHVGYESWLERDRIRTQRRYWRLRPRYGPTHIDACYVATGKLWSGLAHRHYRLTHRAELLHDLVRVKAPTVEPDKTAP